MDPLDLLRSAGGRMTEPADALVQAIAARVTERVVAALDVDALLDRVDVNALLDRVDVNALLDRVDVNRLLGRVDVNALLDRVDIDALVEQTDIGGVIARSSGGVASGALDAVRSEAVGLDEFIARWTGRIRRRPYPGPPGPPPALRMPAPQ